VSRPERPPAPAIELKGVSKAYRIYDKSVSILQEVLLGRTGHRNKVILDNLSLTIAPGEVVGIIGRNGAGKSTLLKLIAGTLSPTSGAIRVSGRVSAILELGTGFNPSYSGRDNVIMSAIMRGMPEAAIRSKFDSVVAFAGLEDVIDEPFHTYSSGMQARLAFAAAVAVDADVIIIDEALAAGDIRFTARSLRRVREICQSGVTALFVSHQTYHVMQLCTRAIWIDDGRVRMDGDPLQVCRAYEYEMHAAIAKDEGRLAAPSPARGDPPEPPSPIAPTAEEPAPITEPSPDDPNLEIAPNDLISPSDVAPDHSVADAVRPLESELQSALLSRTVSDQDTPATSKHFKSNQYRITRVEFLDKDGRETQMFRFGDVFRLRVGYERLTESATDVSCGLAVAFTSTPDHLAVMYFNTNYPHSDDEMRTYFEADFRQYKGRTGVIEATIPFLQLRPGTYLVSMGILPNRPETHEFFEYRHLDFTVTVLPNGFPEPSVFYAMVNWTNGPEE
jgi:ABC-type polysaccharide/polyol phosphate transport system ATPase subunit